MEILRYLLYPFALLYNLITSVRNLLFNIGIKRSTTFRTPIIAIGNLSAGGTGKTPHVEYLVRLLGNRNMVASLSRGYKRKTTGYVLADANTGTHEIGDEPKQIKQKFPHIHVAVCEKRVDGIGQLLQEKPKPNVVILDDAFQHRYVKPHLNILLTDYSKPYWNDMLIPTGMLRENRLGARRAQIIVVTKCPDIGPDSKEQIRKKAKLQAHQKLFFTHIVYADIVDLRTNISTNISSITQEKVLIVSGIARPAPFQNYIAQHAKEWELMKFSDHHDFTASDIEHIKQEFRKGGYSRIITTEKDSTRMDISRFDDIPISYIPISIQFLFGEEDNFNKHIYATLQNMNST